MITMVLIPKINFMKVSDNKLSSLKTYFLQELKDFEEAKTYFSICCEVWLGMNKTDLILQSEKMLSESEILKFLYGVKALKKNEPIQYVVGKSWFYDLTLDVAQGVLIPRPETEELVDWILETDKSVNSILDIGTGSGCIPLALKNNLPSCKISACDISTKALEIARGNAKQLNLDVFFFEMNALDPANWVNEKYDVIVSNPPYIPEQEQKRMDQNVLGFEPTLALFVKDNEPLVFYENIADFAIRNLNNSGELYFEIHEDFGKQTVEMLKGKGFTSLILRKDMQGKDRMVKATLA